VRHASNVVGVPRHLAEHSVASGAACLRSFQKAQLQTSQLVDLFPITALPYEAFVPVDIDLNFNFPIKPISSRIIFQESLSDFHWLSLV